MLVHDGFLYLIVTRHKLTVCPVSTLFPSFFSFAYFRRPEDLASEFSFFIDHLTIFFPSIPGSIY
jgi:hypothetical protein